MAIPYVFNRLGISSAEITVTVHPTWGLYGVFTRDGDETILTSGMTIFGQVLTYYTAQDMHVFRYGKATSTVVNSGTYISACAGAKVNHTTLNSAGSMYIDSGAKIYGVDVKSSGFIRMYPGGEVSALHISSGGKITIPSKASVTGGTFNHCQEIYISGGAVLTNIDMVGMDVICSSAGSVRIASIGSSAGLLVSSGASASELTVLSGGVVSTCSTGIVSGVDLSSGAILAVYNGGAQQVTAAEGADIRFSVLGDQAFISGSGYRGEFSLVSGSASGFDVYNHRTSVYYGCRADSFIVHSGGEMVVDVGGSGSGNVLAYNASAAVKSGGCMTDTAISSGGRMYISAYGVANGVTVSSGARLYVSSGGTATSVSVLDGGEVIRAEGAVVEIL